MARKNFFIAIFMLLASSSVVHTKELLTSNVIDTKAKKLQEKEEKARNKKEFNALTKEKTVQEMSLDELGRGIDLSLKLGWPDQALDYLREIFSSQKDAIVIKKYKLQEADIHFDLGNLKKSGNQYIAYLDLYPGDKYAEYAQYKGILSNHYCLLKTDQDPTCANNTIKLATSFLNSKTIDPQYKKEVESIRLSCYEHLREHEQHVIDFYLKKKNFTAAENRIAYVKKEFGPRLADNEKYSLKLDYRLAERKKDTSMMYDVLNKLEPMDREFHLAHLPKVNLGKNLDGTKRTSGQSDSLFYDPTEKKTAKKYANMF